MIQARGAECKCSILHCWAESQKKHGSIRRFRTCAAIRLLRSLRHMDLGQIWGDQHGADRCWSLFGSGAPLPLIMVRLGGLLGSIWIHFVPRCFQICGRFGRDCDHRCHDRDQDCGQIWVHVLKAGCCNMPWWFPGWRHPRYASLAIGGREPGCTMLGMLVLSEALSKRRRGVFREPTFRTRWPMPWILRSR